MRVGRRTASVAGLACLLAVLEGESVAPRVAHARSVAGIGEPAPPCTITVFGPPSFAPTYAGTYFYQSFSAEMGAVYPVTFALHGTQPPGTTLASNGSLLGTLTTAGTFSFTVQAIDADGCTGSSAPLSLTVGVGIAPATLPNGIVGTPYSQTLNGIGGTAPYTFTLVSPPSSPVPGLSLSTAGVLSGTPTATSPSGQFSFTMRADPTVGVGNRQYLVAIQNTASCSLDVTNTATSGVGSLRNAIICANTHINAGVPDTITFTIPAATDGGCNAATGVCTIAPGTGPTPNTLPDIVDPVFIDGYTQAGSSANTLAIGNDAALKIVLSGLSAGSASGLRFGANAGGSRVRGLVINRFNSGGISILGGAGTTIDGNYIGTDVSGTSAAGNGFNGGVTVADASSTTIGGNTPAARNVISGNSGPGILVSGGGANGAASGNVIKGNYIGLDRTGTVVVGNSGGITVTHADSTQIGGTSAGDGNVITGNQFGGIRLQGGSTGTIIQGNRIGKSFVNGISGPGNGGSSIAILDDSSFTLIGGAQPGAGNILHGSGGTRIESGIGNTISRNTFITNSDVPIVLWPTNTSNTFSRVPNDPCDADGGANLMQNYPVLTSVSSAGGSTTIQGSLNSAPGAPFTLEFYTNTVGDMIEVFDSTVVTTNGGCVADFIFTTSAPVGQGVAVTATDANGNTSQLSEVGFVNADLSILKQMSPNPVGTGSNVTISLDAAYAGPAESEAVTITDTLPSTLKFVSITAAPGWNCTTPLAGAAGVVECTAASMEPGETASFSIVATVDCAVANNTTIGGSAIISSSTTDSDPSNNSSTGSTVASNALPSMTAPPPLSLPNDFGQCARVITNLQFGTPTASDSCSTPTVTVLGVPAGNVFPKGTTTITWKATDGGGAFKTATQDITVYDNEAPLVVLDPVSTTFGNSGPAANRLSGPYGVAVDGAGNVYVADTANHRIQKYGPAGASLLRWGAFGSGNGQFSSPAGVAVDRYGTVYVADTGNNRIQLFSPTGAYVTQWGSFGSGDGQFNSPYGIAVDAVSHVFVADTGNHRIQEFTQSGSFTRKWGGKGSGDGQFDSPIAVAVQWTGFSTGDSVYVADTNNDRIQEFLQGVFRSKWGSSGAAHGQFNRPYGIALDQFGQVFVADSNNHRIETFSLSGGYQATFGGSGTGAGQFAYPIGVAADPANAYFVDWGNNRVHRVAGESVASMPATASVLGSFIDNCADTQSAVLTWTDASKAVQPVAPVSATLVPATGRLSASAPIALPGLYLGSIQMCDSVGNCRTPKARNSLGQELSWAVDDPNGPGVNGSGQINSPAGAYPLNATLSGAASFTFTTSFPKGKTTPIGSLDFAFPAASPYVTASGPLTLSRLEVSGARAQFKGAATCEPGPSPCHVTVTVLDGDQPSGGGVDKFRIKITGYLGEFLYDNGLGAPDSAMPQAVSSDPSNSIDIAKFASAMSLGSSVNPSSPGQSVTFTATVTSSGGTPTGTVKFRDGNAALATVALNASGVAVYTTSALSAGVHTISADYAGTPTIGKSSAALEQSVQAPSTTTLATWINPMVTGQATQLTGAVTGAAGNAQGAVTILDNGVPFDVANLNPKGQFSIKYSTLVPGVHTLTAQYPGGGSYAPSTSTPVAQTVLLRPTATTLTVTPSPSLVHDPVKITVTVTGTGPTPTGNTLLFDNGIQIANGALDKKGKFTFSPAALSFGSHTFLARYLGDASYAQTTVSVGHMVDNFVAAWGTQGAANGQFQSPQGMATDKAGNVYVADTDNNRIQKFTPDGRFMLAWGNNGTGNGQFRTPRGLAVDGSGDVYVADQDNHRIQKFTSKGVFITKWGGFGSGDGQLNWPLKVAIDGAGTVYVADFGNYRIQAFNATGTLIRKWNVPNLGGVGAGGLAHPFAVAADAFGYVYVVDADNNRVQKFTANGDFVLTWGSYGSFFSGVFNAPCDVAVDAAGRVYVADTFNSRIQQFTPTGDFMAKWDGAGSPAGPINVTYGIALDNAGFIYVADNRNHRVMKFIVP